MIVLEESASEQTINLIPRKFTSGNTYNVTVINETTNTEVHNVDTTAIAEKILQDGLAPRRRCGRLPVSYASQIVPDGRQSRPP